jgi:hypothetical protein
MEDSKTVGAEIHPSILSGYGLIEAPFEPVTERFGTHSRADQSQMRIHSVIDSPSDALDYLSTRSVPATRLVLVDLGRWTGVLTNDRNGSDFSNHQYWAGTSTGAKTVRVVDSEARWFVSDDLRERLDYEARIVEIEMPDGSLVRSIACADDGGRWVFETFGQPLPIEAAFNYAAPRKKDRFTRENLRDLLVALGPGPLTEHEFLAAPRFALLAEEWNRAWRVETCSLEEADDPAYHHYLVGMSYVGHMETSAASVVADFEKAIQFNPAYEPKVRAYLEEARRRLRAADDAS